MLVGQARTESARHEQKRVQATEQAVRGEGPTAEAYAARA